MERTVQDWSIADLHKERAAISFPEYQRQPNLWSVEKKRLLIDSILKDIDIPKLYFNLTDNGFEVVDGQQRLWAIWEFLDDTIDLEVGGESKKFSELLEDDQEVIKKYNLQVVMFDNADDEYLRQLFLRLQLGLLLVTGEKLNAVSGKLKEFIFDEVSNHQFIVNLGIPERRFAKQTLAAQICINSFSRDISGNFARTRAEDLVQFLRRYESPRGGDLTTYEASTKKIVDTLNSLAKCLGDNVNKLSNRSYILTLYLLFEELKKAGQIEDNEKTQQFSEFIGRLWDRLREEMKAGMDRTNRELYEFQSLISSAPGEKYQIERRHNKMKQYLEYFYEHKGIKGDPI